MYKDIFVNSRLFFLFLLTLGLNACYYARPKVEATAPKTDTAKIDSASFIAAHHYWKGHNFTVVDSLVLRTTLPLNTAVTESVLEDISVLADSFAVQRDKRLVIADIRFALVEQGDSIWLKIATEDAQTGWVQEGSLLKQTVPDNPISRFVFYFSSNRLLIFLTLFIVALAFGIAKYHRRRRWHIVHLNDINSFYPTALCLSISTAAALYGVVQAEAPALWVEFYFHPTLNPFAPALPLLLRLFLLCFWTVIVIGTATLEEFYRRTEIRHRMVYLSILMVVCAVLYIVFTLSMRFYVGYPLLLGYWVFAWKRYQQQKRGHYRCGNCKEMLLKLGRCPHCGAINE